MTVETSQAAPTIQQGDPLPAFDLPATVTGRVSAQSLRDKVAILYLYPKADTTGCTQEAKAFQAAIDAAGPGAPTVIGVSRDKMKALEAFATKAGLSFPLVSDEAGDLVMALGAWVEKSMYGRTYMGIDRSTFLVDADGRIVQIWRKVKVPGHAAAVAAAAAELSGR